MKNIGKTFEYSKSFNKINALRALADWSRIIHQMYKKATTEQNNKLLAPHPLAMNETIQFMLQTLKKILFIQSLPLSPIFNTI